MAYLDIKNINVKGIIACLPHNIVENREYSTVPEPERDSFIEAIGIERRHCVEGGVRASDLCQKAAEQLLVKIGWERSDVDLLIFVSQTPDYKMPATSCVLQYRLGLPKSCMTIDISQGCSGYVYGLGVAGSLMSSGTMKKCLLLVGNTQSLNLNYKDKSVYPLFSDAGSATAIEYCDEIAKSDTFKLSFATDGSGEHTIIIPDGGYRNMVSPDSFVEEEIGPGITRNRLNVSMHGDDVFAFVIGNIPRYTKDLFEHFEIDSTEIDYYLLHHASKFLCNKLIKKLQIPEGKAPLILKDYGNSSNATIPLLITKCLRDDICSRRLNLYVTGFGVGLSLGVGVISIGNLVCADLIEI